VTAADSDYLIRLASLSLSFVGFSSVVVTLRGALGGELSERHVRLVRLYIEGGFLVTALALLPAMLGMLGVAPAVAWPLASAIAALILSLVLVTQFRRRRAIEAGRFPFWVVVIYAVSVVAVLRLWLNVVGWPQPSGAGAYAVVLTWALGLFGFIFVRTIELFLHRTSRRDGV